MARFGDFKVLFFDADDWDAPLSDTDGVAFRVPIRGTTYSLTNAAGRTEITLGYDAKLGELAQEGRMAVVYQYDALVDPPYIGGVPFCLPFIIESITPEGSGLMRIEGPDLLEELKNSQHFTPIGAATTTSTTVAEAVADPATTTVATAAPVNNDHVQLASTSGWLVGDEARVELDDDMGTHVTNVTAVNPPDTTDTIVLADRLPHAAGVGNDVTRRRRTVKVAAGQGAAFAVGVEVRLTLDDNTVHTTLAAADPEDDVITMRDGAPDGAAVGKDITATHYNTPTTEDVTKIVAYAAGWGWEPEFENVGYTGTAAGTHHAPLGESVLDLLVSTAKRTGEFFRLKDPGAAIAPERKVVWRRTRDYAQWSGSNLRLVQPTQANIDSEAANPARAIITGDVERVGIYQPVTRIVPLAGDKRITLALCSEEARLQAQVEGLTLVDTGLGLYTPPYLVNEDAETALGRMIARTVTFSEIRTETDHATEYVSQADALMRAAIAYLYEHGTGVRYKYTVPDVVCPVPILPGQRIEMVYSSPDGRWSINKVAGNALYVLEVRAQFGPPDEDPDGNLNDRGKLVTLTLVESHWDVPDIESATAAAIANVERVARLVGGNAGGMGEMMIIAGGGDPVDPGEHDHLEFVRLDGTSTMTGNLVMAAGKLVDGVDLTAHVANAAAHHNPVTAADSSIAVSTQAIRVSENIAGAGLVMSGGVLAANVSAAKGTQILDDAIALLPVSTGGLTLTAGGAAVLLPTNSGLQLGASGLVMGTPGTLTAGTVNNVSAASHTHAVTATADALTTAGTLLKGGAAGELTLARAGVGVAANNAAALMVRAQSTDDYTLWLKQLTGQTADMWRVEDVAGNPLIRLTGGGDLESGTPAFVSRVTGWQIQSDGSAEFNNVFVRGELHAATFVADEMHATGGTLAVMTAAKVASPVGASDNILAAVGSSFTLNVQASWDTGLCYFAANDVVRVKPMGEIVSGGSLDLYDIYMTVTSTGSIAGRNLANGNAGYFPMTVVRRYGGATGFEIPAGSAAVKWARVSGSGYTGGMILTSDLSQSPYLDIFTIDATQTGTTWQSAPVTPIPRVRVGNLRGVLGKSADEWGMAAGTNLSDATVAARYIVASDGGVELRNVDLAIYTGGERVINLAQGTNPYLAIGASGAPSGYGAGGAGLWVGSDSGTYKMRLGYATGAALLWTGTGLALRDQSGNTTISLGGDGTAFIGGPLTLGTSGGIYQGTGTFASPTTGLKLYRDGSIGRITSYNSGTAQASFDTDGQFKSAYDGSAWNVIMGSSGLTLGAAQTVDDDDVISSTVKRVTWKNGATTIGWIGGRYYVTGQHGIELMAADGVGIKIMNSAARTPSLITTDGDLKLVTPSGYAVRIYNGLSLEGTSISGVLAITADNVNGDELYSTGGVYAGGPIVAGGTSSQFTRTDAGTVNFVPRSSAPANPNSNFTSLYIYYNSGTGKNELTLRNAAGTTVKVAEINAA